MPLCCVYPTTPDGRCHRGGRHRYRYRSPPRPVLCTVYRRTSYYPDRSCRSAHLNTQAQPAPLRGLGPTTELHGPTYHVRSARTPARLSTLFLIHRSRYRSVPVYSSAQAVACSYQVPTPGTRRVATHGCRISASGPRPRVVTSALVLVARPYTLGRLRARLSTPCLRLDCGSNQDLDLLCPVTRAV